MAGISRYERAVLGLTAAFVLFTSGWFFAQRSGAQPYQVTTVRQEEAPAAPDGSEESARPDSLLEGEVINLNTASAGDLQRLPGIGEKRAMAIIAYREANGPFQSVEELDHVDGIGSGILSGLEGYVTVSEKEG